MNLRFLSAALQEIHDAYDYYELQRQGLGEEFAFELNAALQKVRDQPQA